MPLYQTRTIAGILEPVAQQVPTLVPVPTGVQISILLTILTLPPGQQADNPARGGRGWELHAGPADTGSGRQQGRCKPCQVRNHHVTALVAIASPPALSISYSCRAETRLLSCPSHRNVEPPDPPVSRVGRDTINSSQDMKMKSEMPKSLAAIEKASEYLMEASNSLGSDPYSQVRGLAGEMVHQ